MPCSSIRINVAFICPGACHLHAQPPKDRATKREARFPPHETAHKTSSVPTFQVSKVTIHMEAATIDHSVTPTCALPRLIELTGPPGFTVRWDIYRFCSFLGHVDNHWHTLTPSLPSTFPPRSISISLLFPPTFCSSSSSHPLFSTSSRVSVTISQFCFNIRTVLQGAALSGQFSRLIRESKSSSIRPCIGTVLAATLFVHLDSSPPYCAFLHLQNL